MFIARPPAALPLRSEERTRAWYRRSAVRSSERSRQEGHLIIIKHATPTGVNSILSPTGARLCSLLLQLIALRKHKATGEPRAKRLDWTRNAHDHHLSVKLSVPSGRFPRGTIA
jgi:hypothetical protein